MTPDEEPPERKLDILEIGINVIEVAVMAAILYAIIHFLCQEELSKP